MQCALKMLYKRTSHVYEPVHVSFILHTILLQYFTLFNWIFLGSYLLIEKLKGTLHIAHEICQMP